MHLFFEIAGKLCIYTVGIYVSWSWKVLLEFSASLKPPHPISGSSYVLQVIRIKKSKITDVLVILNNPFFKRLLTCKCSKFNTVLKQSNTTFRSCTELGAGHPCLHSYKTLGMHISSTFAKMSEQLFFGRNSLQGEVLLLVGNFLFCIFHLTLT